MKEEAVERSGSCMNLELTTKAFSLTHWTHNNLFWRKEMKAHRRPGFICLEKIIGFVFMHLLSLTISLMSPREKNSQQDVRQFVIM